MAPDIGRGTASAIEGPANLPTLDPDVALELLDRSTVNAVSFARPRLVDTPYRAFVEALLAAPPLRFAFDRMPPQAAFETLSEELFGPGQFVAEREVMARHVASLAAFCRDLAGSAVSITLRTYFAPGDLVWHVDRSQHDNALRILWPLGRAAGMRVTEAGNLDHDIYDPFMRRELPLLCELDREVMRTGGDLETLWAHRPRQVQAMMSGRYAFLRDGGRVWEIPRDAISIHRFQTPRHTGTYHRSAWENRLSPGLQIVLSTGGA